MHHPKKFLNLIFERHAKQHHIFFNYENMAFESSQDFKMVLFPPIMIIFFLGAFALPLGLLLAWPASTNVGCLFVATGIAYFLNYQLFHFAYHLPESNPLFKTPGLKYLRQLHHNHHKTEWMSKYNFNITYPIGDYLFGILRRSKDESS